jgi:hypothetical protein
VLTARLADVVDSANVGMGHLERGSDLVEEALEANRVVLDLAGQELQSYRLAEFEIVRPVNLAHAATTLQSHDAVTLVDDGAGNEARLVSVREIARSPATTSVPVL